MRLAARSNGDPTRWVTAATAGLTVAATLAVLSTPYYRFAPAPALLLAAGLILTARPAWAYGLMVLLLPFAAFRGPLHTLLGVGLLAVVFIHCLGARRFPIALPSGPGIGLLAFVAAQVVACVSSPYPEAAWPEFWILVVNLSAFLVHVYFLRGAILWRWLPRLMVVSIGVSGGLAAIGYFLDVPRFTDGVEGFPRGTGGSLSAPGMAMLIVIALPVIAALIRSATSPWTRAGWAAVSGTCLLGLTATYSRGGALVGAIGIAGIAWSFRDRIRSRHLGLVIAAACAAAGVAAVTVPPSYWERAMSLTDPEDFSIGRRSSYIVVAVDAWRERPWLGAGTETFPEFYRRSEYAMEFQRKSQDTLARRAHNTYLEVLVGSGLFGLAAFLGVFAAAWIDFGRAAREAVRRGMDHLAAPIRMYRLSLALMALYFLIYSNLGNKYFVLWLALSQAVRRGVGEEPAPPGEPLAHVAS